MARRAGREGRFDDIVGRGSQLIVAAGDPLVQLSSRRRALVDRLEMKGASLDASAPGGVHDVDGRLPSWLSERGLHVVIVRPDFYVFGSAGAEGITQNA